MGTETNCLISDVFTYTFKDRYTIGGTLRNDGSSVLLPSQMGMVPGCFCSMDCFGREFHETAKVVDFLKVRAGIGTSVMKVFLTGGNYSLTTYAWRPVHSIITMGFYLRIVQRQKGTKT